MGNIVFIWNEGETIVGLRCFLQTQQQGTSLSNGETAGGSRVNAILLDLDAQVDPPS